MAAGAAAVVAVVVLDSPLKSHEAARAYDLAVGLMSQSTVSHVHFVCLESEEGMAETVAFFESAMSVYSWEVSSRPVKVNHRGVGVPSGSPQGAPLTVHLVPDLLVSDATGSPLNKRASSRALMTRNLAASKDALGQDVAAGFAAVLAPIFLRFPPSLVHSFGLLLEGLIVSVVCTDLDIPFMVQPSPADADAVTASRSTLLMGLHVLRLARGVIWSSDHVRTSLEVAFEGWSPCHLTKSSRVSSFVVPFASRVRKPVETALSSWNPSQAPSSSTPLTLYFVYTGVPGDGGSAFTFLLAFFGLLSRVSGENGSPRSLVSLRALIDCRRSDVARQALIALVHTLESGCDVSLHDFVVQGEGPTFDDVKQARLPADWTLEPRSKLSESLVWDVPWTHIYQGSGEGGPASLCIHVFPGTLSGDKWMDEAVCVAAQALSEGCLVSGPSLGGTSSRAGMVAPSLDRVIEPSLLAGLTLPDDPVMSLVGLVDVCTSLALLPPSRLASLPPALAGAAKAKHDPELVAKSILEAYNSMG